MTFRLLCLDQSLRSIDPSPTVRREGKSLVYEPCILEFERFGGTLLGVVVLLLHRKWRGGLRGDSRLEICSGLGRGSEGELTTHPDDLYPPRWT